jgi:PIN domain nuclease of toxin-antitoxin system
LDTFDSSLRFSTRNTNSSQASAVSGWEVCCTVHRRISLEVDITKYLVAVKQGNLLSQVQEFSVSINTSENLSQ